MGRIADSAEERPLLRQPGAIMLVSCYELGHQPLGIAQPIGFLEQAGFAPVGLDIARRQHRRISLSAGAVCRHLGAHAHGAPAWGAGRRADPRDQSACHICFYGLYASHQCGIFAPDTSPILWWAASTSLPLVSLIEALDCGQAISHLEGVSSRTADGRSLIAACLYINDLEHPPANPESRWTADVGPICADSNRTARSGWSDTSRPVADASIIVSIARSCRSMTGDSSSSRKPSSSRTFVARCMAGATHITFGDPDFLNGPGIP